MNRAHQHTSWTVWVFIAVLAGAGSNTHAAHVIIAQEGDAAPDANGTFANFVFDSAVLNDAGQVGFRGVLTGTSGGAGR